MDIKEIQRHLPHRFPMLLVDRVEEIELSKTIKGYKNVTSNEAFFVGHYPGMPIMPGVLIIEAIAQMGALILLADPTHAGCRPLIAGMDKVKFRRPVVPGDRLDIACEVLWFRNLVGMMHGTASVNGEIAAEADIAFKILKDGDEI